MAKILSPELVKFFLPSVVSALKAVAALTTNTLDDKLAAAAELALSNPLVLDYILSMLGLAPAPVVQVNTPAGEAVAELSKHKELVQGLFAIHE